ncbi:FAD-dependent oxidoreductase [Modestobacter sp. VKM Ac-2979]|uniref:NAD(P)/FAD-dependent oxidoreductase n=1 Tax=unclassified Modestobacter TaxID=2643866 RepID=UPI0022AB8B57|nr:MULTISPECIES: FAD-dependent oxidoreductase [unclassified Modestobacter]MCZ2811990.1 FAD-dependent oxidoreductase [Modestobacter sp. VKM Ac-2979]
MPRSADAVIIGAGVLGLLTALELRRAGMSVVVLDAGLAGNAQSGSNLGFVRQQGRGTSETTLMRRSTELWGQLHGRLGDRLGWTGGGHASVGRDAATETAVHSWAPIAREQGIPFELFGPRAAAQRFPWMGAGVRVVGFTPTDGHLDPVLAMQAIRALALSEGVQLLENVPAVSMDIAAGNVVGVQTPDATIRAGATVLAAGMWSSRLLRRHGVHLPQYTGVGTVVRTVPVPRLTRSTVWDLTGVGMRQDVSGRINFGLGQHVDIDVGWEEVSAAPRLLRTYLGSWRTLRLHAGRRLAGDVGSSLRRLPLAALPLDRPEANPKLVARARRELGRLVPGLGEGVEIESAWAGTIDSSADFLPVIGEVGLGGLAVLTGMSGHGMGIAPAAAEAVAQIVVAGDAKSADISALDPRRLRGFRAYDTHAPR